MSIDKTQIRNAATVIVLRDRFQAPRILMGQRGAKAVFMPCLLYTSDAADE